MYGESKSVTFPGKVVAASDINLAFRISGPIAKVYVDAGRYVKKGQVLAEIDPRDYVVQLSATEAEYERIKSEAERVIALYEKGSIAPNDYDKAVYGLNQITAKREAHKNALADTKLCVPCDGYIQKRLFEPGETVSAGLPVLSMISAGTDEVEINIPSSDYIRRDQFDNFYCTVDIYQGETFPLELVGITQKANMNQLYTMRLRLTGKGKNKPGPGMSILSGHGLRPVIH
ncbi:efflux RND transporter periplasmic adaptor subunit [Parabacteroides sp. OttesenSCG-928-G06]|nr:efflux RND transporter periplasmic adaptor subunit [Parabacteroides sp. OttesenSCG-928-K15]MDL2282646.1 efflux RND transporter periplasmic adaptor subunit [Parabacteroides sp. OttesenSCG-928-G06]